MNVFGSVKMFLVYIQISRCFGRSSESMNSLPSDQSQRIKPENVSLMEIKVLLDVVRYLRSVTMVTMDLCFEIHTINITSGNALTHVCNIYKIIFFCYKYKDRQRFRYDVVRSQAR